MTVNSIPMEMALPCSREDLNVLDGLGWLGELFPTSHN